MLSSSRCAAQKAFTLLSIDTTLTGHGIDYGDVRAELAELRAKHVLHARPVHIPSLGSAGIGDGY